MKSRNFRNALAIGAIGLFSYFFLKNQDRIAGLTSRKKALPPAAPSDPQVYVQHRREPHTGSREA